MAEKVNRRVNSGAEKRRQYDYGFDGNAARELETIPEEKRKKRRKVNKAASRNREKAKKMNAGFVTFLAAASVVAMFMCVNYLKLKSNITTQAKQIAFMETEISQLKADNDAYYNNVLSSVDLEFIKDAAMERLAMKYPDEHQVFHFDTAGNSYVRQYRSVPDTE